jgi:hypothetical protein
MEQAAAPKCAEIAHPRLGASANAILRVADRLDLMGLTLIFKLGAIPYDMVERSMTAFGAEVVPRIRHLLDHTTAAPALHVV